jgi:phosphoribosylanthranilate isomerase
VSKVKICGISRAEDIKAINRAQPDFIGFVFAPSRRRININIASVLKEKLDPRIETVGVFVDENIDVVAEMYKSGIVDLVQLHGDEDDRYIKQLKQICGCRVIKAVGVTHLLPPLPHEADYIIFDTISNIRGGTGCPFEWNILSGYSGLPYFLAGGLSIDNVAHALHLLTPFCVDVSSGVETSGVKDGDKIERFVYSVRELKQ